MLKVRVTFVDNEKGNRELKEFLKLLEQDTDVLYESPVKKEEARVFTQIYT
jgi:hypothetical protein